jgi:hypothetical protein
LAATIVVEMRDHLVVVEGPLYDARTAPVVQSIRKNSQQADSLRESQPIITSTTPVASAPSLAAGATVIIPFAAKEFYSRVAKAPHTRKPDSLASSLLPSSSNPSAVARAS